MVGMMVAWLLVAIAMFAFVQLGRQQSRRCRWMWQSGSVACGGKVGS